MKLEIFVPTKGRANAQITANQLTAARIRHTLVCSRDDADDQLESYRSQLSKLRGILVCPAKTIYQKRQWILEGAQEKKSKLVMLDDDLTFYVRRTQKKFERAEPDDVRVMFEWFDDALNDYAHAGIVDKFMSQSTPRGHVLSRRYNGVLGYNTRLFPRGANIRFRIPVSEEHDVHLQLATRGLPPIVSTEFSKSTTYYNPGGCTDERTARSEAEGHRLFASKWPDLVKVVPHEKNASGLAIRVRWREAAKEKHRVP